MTLPMKPKNNHEFSLQGRLIYTRMVSEEYKTRLQSLASLAKRDTIYKCIGQNNGSYVPCCYSLTNPIK